MYRLRNVGFVGTLSSIQKHLLRRYKQTGVIVAEPVQSLVTDTIKLHGYGFPVNSPLTVCGKVEIPSQRVSFKSFAHIITSSDGYFDLSETESVGGTYTGVDNMGLLWSMRHGEGSKERFQLSDVTVPVTYEFSTFNGHVDEFINNIPICSCTVQRKFVSDKVNVIDIKEGRIRGKLFLPTGTGPFPGIITIYGGTVGGCVTQDSAAILANYGFATLALAFYGVDGLPKNYAKEPLNIEYFEEAIDFLSSHPKVKSDGIGLYGQSMGGNIALTIISSVDTKIKSVVCVNGCVSCSVMPYIYKDTKIEPLQIDLKKVEVLSDNYISIRDIYSDPRDEPWTIIPFEKSEADLLWIVSLDDSCWNSELYADIGKVNMDIYGKKKLRNC